MAANTNLNTKICDTKENIFDEIKKNCGKESSEKILQIFDEDKDGALNFIEFEILLSQLFCNNHGEPYHIHKKQKTEIFGWFDVNRDGLLDEEEFHLAWKHWIYQILNPVSALLIIDVQNDFITGTLAIKNCPAKHDGALVVPVINRILDTVKFDTIVYTLDWHPENHCSFIENIGLRKLHNSSNVTSKDAKVYDTVIFEGPPISEQKLWPSHCVQGSWGAQFHQDLKQVKEAIIIKKGVDPDVDSYSAFWDNNKLKSTSLLEKLQEKNVTDVFVCGIAYDICVAYTAMDALQHKLRTILIGDAAKGITLEGIEKTKQQLIDNNAVIIAFDNVSHLVSAADRPFALGYQSALRVAEELKLKHI